MHGLMQRQSVVLSQPKWLANPWQDVHKSTEQKVYDYGLVLTGLFERIDMLSLDDKKCLSILKACNDIRHGIESIMEQDLQSSCEYGDDLATDNGYHAGIPRDGETHESLAVILLRTIAMGIALGACTTACKAYRQLISKSSFVHNCEELDSIYPWDIKHTGTAMCEKQRSLARAILCSIATFVARMDDVVCNAKLLFSLRQAFEQFAPEDAEYTECVVIMQKLRIDTWRFGALTRGSICSYESRDHGNK